MEYKGSSLSCSGIRDFISVVTRVRVTVTCLLRICNYMSIKKLMISEEELNAALD